MEYRLLKSIEPTQGILLPKETLPRLTAYPANNCVNPGLGQIARLYSFYVPLHSNPNLHSISKNEADVEPLNVEPLNQEGKGEDSVSDIKTNIPELQKDNEANDESYLNPIDFNERKRKLLGSAVHESFLHPKIIKTDKIVFSKQKPVNKTTSATKSDKSVPPLKPIKHKFQFL
jgi:hypothetical protein